MALESLKVNLALTVTEIHIRFTLRAFVIVQSTLDCITRAPVVCQHGNGGEALHRTRCLWTYPVLHVLATERITVMTVPEAGPGMGAGRWYYFRVVRVSPAWICSTSTVRVRQ